MNHRTRDLCAAVLLSGLVLGTAETAAAQDPDGGVEELERRLDEIEQERRRILRALGRRDPSARAAAPPGSEASRPAPARAAPPPRRDPAADDLRTPRAAGSDLDDAIVVVARRFAADAEATTPSVTTFDRRDIERRQATHVADLLRETPGLLVLQDGPRGQTARVFTRGAASNQTLFVIDGVPQNDATTGGGYDLNDLSADAIERVEVLRGSYGVLYGSEAIGGVVSIETRRGGGPTRGFARVEGGSFDTHSQTVGVSGVDERVDFALTGSAYRTHGERRRESFANDGVTARFGVELSERAHLATSVRWVDSAIESPFDFASTGALPEDANIRRTRRTVAWGTTLTIDASDWLAVRLHGSLLDIDTAFRNGPDGPSVIDPDFTPGTGDESVVVRDELDSETTQTDLRGRLEATAWISDALRWRAPEDGGLGLEVTAGGEYLDQDSLGVTTFPDFNAPTSSTTRIEQARITRSLFAQAQVALPHAGAFERSHLTLGIREDDHSSFGTEGSPFLGGRTRFEPTATTLRAAYGEGFRAPKPSEQSDPFVGNEDLGPETSRGWDVGLSQPLLGERLVVSTTYFRLRVDDLIAYDATDTTPARPFGRLVNFQNTETRGWEHALTARLSDELTLRGTLTTQNPRDLDTSLNLPNRAKHFGSAGLTWEHGRLRVSVDAFVSGRNPDQGGEVTYPEPRERRRPGRRELVDLAIRYRLSDTVSLHARVENLLDDDWVATPTAPAGPPLGVFVGARIEF